MTSTQREQIKAFIRNRRADAERRSKRSVNPAVPGNQPRTQRELNIAMVAEESAKLALLSDLEALMHQQECGQ